MAEDNLEEQEQQQKFNDEPGRLRRGSDRHMAVSESYLKPMF